MKRWAIALIVFNEPVIRMTLKPVKNDPGIQSYSRICGKPCINNPYWPPRTMGWQRDIECLMTFITSKELLRPTTNLAVLESLHLLKVTFSSCFSLSMPCWFHGVSMGGIQGHCDSIAMIPRVQWCIDILLLWNVGIPMEDPSFQIIRDAYFWKTEIGESKYIKIICWLSG